MASLKVGDRVRVKAQIIDVPRLYGKKGRVTAKGPGYRGELYFVNLGDALSFDFPFTQDELEVIEECITNS